MSEKCLPGKNQPQRMKAFTLVELLVVIGIIAILISIILPSLAAARKSANQVKCAAALEEIGNAFKLYSIDNKGTYPVQRWDIPAASQHDYPEIKPPAPYALYWQDFLVKYISKNTSLNSAAVNGGNGLARNGIFWGCPEWQGRYGGFTSPDGTSAYENGYAMNPFPNWKPTTPLGKNPPASGWAMSWAVFPGGVWPKITQYNAERCLVMEANLWLPYTGGTDASHTIMPEYNCSSNKFTSEPAVIGPTGPNYDNEPAGYNSIDRYRHGTYPPLEADGVSFDPTRGKVKYNMLFGDGHVSELNSINDGVQAIQMRAP